MLRSIRKKCLLFALTALPVMLGAADLEEYFRLNGFATVGASTVFEEKQEFRAYTFQEDGVRKGEVNLVNNTLFGLQGTIQATDALSATVQGVAYNIREREYEIKADWAYLSYVTDMGLALRAGKFRLPLFNSSELTYIGYARSWVRPALPFYGVAGFSHYTGGNVIYHMDGGAVLYSLEAGYGIGDEESGSSSNGRRTFDSNDILIVKATMDAEYFHAGLTYFHAHTRMRAYTRDDRQISDITTLAQMVSAEGELYLGNLTFEGGMGYGWTANSLPNEILAYAGASYQMDAWRPYALYSVKAFDHKSVDYPELPQGAPPPPPHPTYVSENIFSLGVRYDFIDQADLKIQVDRALGMKYVPQLLISDDPNQREATVLTIAVDMVF